MAALARLLLAAALLATVLLHAAAADGDAGIMVQYAPQQAEQVRAAIAAQGCTVLQEATDARVLLVDCEPAGGDGGAVSAASASRLLASMPGVAAAEPNTILRAPMPLDTPVAAAAATASAAAAGALQQQQQQQQCATTDPTKPDAALAVSAATQEFTPWGLRAVQAADPAMIELSKSQAFRDNVMFCVIDSGLDISNKEFPAGTIGCRPTKRPGSNETRACEPFTRDMTGHGTHAAGTIAAQRNGRGVVGAAAEGVQLYAYKLLGDTNKGTSFNELLAWADCIAELDARKAASNNPAMKMVVSMSYGSVFKSFITADELARLARSRRDVLWLAAAGNEGAEQTYYPAGYPQVISVGAVDAALAHAPFSNRSPQLELVAPGVAVVSTTTRALARESDVTFPGFAAVTASPLLKEVAADPGFFWRPPAKVPFGGVSLAGAAGRLVDCGLGAATCTGAAGAVCLLQRGGGIKTCDKVHACMKGGGVGAIVYHTAEAAECESMPDINMAFFGCPAVKYPTVLLLARRQGEALKAALASGVQLNVTLRTPPAADRDLTPLTTYDGTSMATPAAAGVAGLVWGAHVNCTADEVRAALQASALKPAGMAGATRDAAYGYGVVQALEAHKYLQARRCAADKAAVTLILRVSPARVTVGDTVTVRLTATHASARTRLARVAVRLAVGPSAASLECRSYALSTDVSGAASTSCRVLGVGRSVLTARMPGTEMFKPAVSNAAAVTGMMPAAAGGS